MSYQLKVIKDYPIAFWPLDESSGSTASDASGCGNNGTYHGSPATNILPIIPGGISGTKITSSSYISLPTNNDFYGSTVSHGLANIYSSDNDFTLEVWFCPSIESSSLTPIVADSSNNIGLYWQNGDVVFKVSNTNEIRWAVPYSKKAFHLVGIYNVNSISLYLDGKIVGSKILDSFSFENTTLDLQAGPTGNVSDSFLIDAPAVYRYALPPNLISSHYSEGLISANQIHVVSPENGVMFACTDQRNKIAFEYAYGISRKWDEFLNEDTYYDANNKWITFYKTETPDPKQLVINDFLMLPSAINYITSKVEWRNDLGITVEASVDGTNYIQCVNGQAIPQYQKGSFDTSGLVYLRITMSTSDASTYLPRLSFFAVRFYTDNDIYSENYGSKITSDSEIYAGSLNYPILSRNYLNGIRPEDGTGFDLNTDLFVNSVEMFFTPLTTGANTLFYDPTTGSKYAWNGSGTVSKTGVSKIYVNGVDKTSQTNISNFLVAEEPHHIVIVFAAAVTGVLQFNYQTSGGPSNLYSNIAIYESTFTEAQIQTHYDIYVGRPASSNTEPVITLTQLDPVYYNNDWIIIQTA